MILTDSTKLTLANLGFRDVPDYVFYRGPSRFNHRPDVHGLPDYKHIGFRASRGNTPGTLVFSTSDLRIEVSPLPIDVSADWFEEAQAWIADAKVASDRVKIAEDERQLRAATFEARWKGQKAEIEASIGTTIPDIHYRSPLTLDATSGDIISVDVLIKVTGTPTQIATKLKTLAALKRTADDLKAAALAEAVS